jgi:hypothetical protein
MCYTFFFTHCSIILEKIIFHVLLFVCFATDMVGFWDARITKVCTIFLCNLFVFNAYQRTVMFGRNVQCFENSNAEDSWHTLALSATEISLFLFCSSNKY